LFGGIREEFEDTKGVIRIRISKKNRQHNQCPKEKVQKEIENHRPMPTELNEISTNEVSRGSYKAITIHITLGRDEFPQHCNTGAQQSNPHRTYISNI
jgi:hypothetical protein